MWVLWLLGLLFIGLKLGHVIAWSWLLVLLPFWIIPVIVLSMLILTLFGVGTVAWLDVRKSKRRGPPAFRR